MKQSNHDAGHWAISEFLSNNTESLLSGKEKPGLKTHKLPGIRVFLLNYKGPSFRTSIRMSLKRPDFFFKFLQNNIRISYSKCLNLFSQNKALPNSQNRGTEPPWQKLCKFYKIVFSFPHKENRLCTKYILWIKSI